MGSFADININNQELLCWKTLMSKMGVVDLFGPGLRSSLHLWTVSQYLR